ncbi:MAG: oligosaccharide flippase family protein [Candidatus Omnitrophica bacterium]|nr:oligosaccharide flippase family protein [Candidatus Omnitrophota bacterium]
MRGYIKSAYFLYKKYIHNFSWRYFGYFARTCIAFFIFLIAARLLTPEAFGKYNYFIAIASLLAIFGDFGISTSVSKYVPEYRIKNRGKIKSILFSSLTICFILSFSVSIFVLIFGKELFSEDYIYILYTIPLIFLISGVRVFDGFYRGSERFKELAIISLISGLVGLGSAYFLILLYGVAGAIFTQVLSYLVLFTVLTKFTKESFTPFDKKIAKTISKYALVVGLSGLAYFLYTRIDIIILGYYGYTIEIGYYSIIDKFFQFLFIPFVLFGQVIAPDVTKLVTQKKYQKVKQRGLNIIYLFILGICISIFVYFLVPPIIKSILPEYFKRDLLMILNVLLFLLPFKICGVLIVNGFVVPSGLAKIVTVITGIGGILNVLLDFLFIKWYGFIGVFYVTALLHSLAIIFTYIIYYRSISKRALG